MFLSCKTIIFPCKEEHLCRGKTTIEMVEQLFVNVLLYIAASHQCHAGQNDS